MTATAPVLTHERIVASKRFTDPILASESKRVHPTAHLGSPSPRPLSLSRDSARRKEKRGKRLCFAAPCAAKKRGGKGCVQRAQIFGYLRKSSQHFSPSRYSPVVLTRAKSIVVPLFRCQSRSCCS